MTELSWAGGPRKERQKEPKLTPTATLKTGEWIATVDGEIVARGLSFDEAVERAQVEGYEDFVVERVGEPGGFIL